MRSNALLKFSLLQDPTVGKKQNKLVGGTLYISVGECMDKAFKNFKPRPPYSVVKIGQYKPLTVKHKITGY